MTCTHCSDDTPLEFTFSFAFQPIVDVRDGSVYSYEALVRGPQGEPAGTVLGRVTDANRYRFDQACRVAAVAWAARLKVPSRVNINFLPNAVYQPKACIRSTLRAADEHAFPIERIVFEITEGEEIRDRDHLRGIIEEYKALGFGTAIDDFGAGYSGLNLLADYQPDQIKLDLALTRNIDVHPARQSIVRGIIQVCQDLGIGLIAEGIESAGELAWLRDAGVHLMQGFLLARPGFETLPAVDTGVLVG